MRLKQGRRRGSGRLDNGSHAAAHRHAENIEERRQKRSGLRGFYFEYSGNASVSEARRAVSSVDGVKGGRARRGG